MSDDDFDLERGSGNVFRDLGLPDPDLEQLRALLAAQIIKTLDRRGLTAREAAKLTGLPEADFSRIRHVKLGRFTIDRLMTVLGRLGEHVEVKVKIRPAARKLASALAHG